MTTIEIRHGEIREVNDGGYAVVLSGGYAVVLSGGYADVGSGGHAYLSEQGALRRVERDDVWYTEVAAGPLVSLVPVDATPTEEAPRD